jgi:hypothetical protein
MRPSLRWIVIALLLAPAACVPATVEIAPTITRPPDYVDAARVEVTASRLTITGTTSLRDDVCLHTRLLQDDRPVAWWPDGCYFAYVGRVRVEVPFGQGGAPAALEAGSRYVFEVEARDAPAIRDALAFDTIPPPTAIPPTSTATVASVIPTATPRAATLANPIPTFDASLPAARLISGNTLIEQDARGGRRTLAEPPEAGEVRQAIQVGDEVLLWRGQGLQRVSLRNGRVALAVPFDEPAVLGNLVAAPNGRTVVYAVTEADACVNGAAQTVIHQYRLDTGETRTVFSAPRTVRVVGLSSDGSTLYLQPVGCDPEFGELWAVSLLTGKMAATLPARSEAERYVGVGAAQLSTSARYLAFGAHRPAGEAGFETATGLYDLALTPPKLTWLDIPPGIAWHRDTRWLYYLRDGALFRYELSSGESVELGKVPVSATRLLYATADGNGLVLTDDDTRTVVYFDVKQKTALEAPLSTDAPVVLVMPQ